MRNLKTKYLLPVITAVMAMLTIIPAEAQNKSGGESQPTLSVRRQRQSASTPRKTQTKKQVEAKPAAKKTDTATKGAITPTKNAANDTAKNANPSRPRFVPRQQRAAAATPKTSDERAQIDFPTAPDMPKDVSWRRDIYRTLDLTQDANATLYYPLEQQGDQINLFTYILKLILRGQVKAYDYSLNGNENFDAKNQVKPKDILDRYHIYYETKDGRMHINDSDIPAAEVLEYFLKESSYFDQHTATYHTKVTALCPVLKKSRRFRRSRCQISHVLGKI